MGLGGGTAKRLVQLTQQLFLLLGQLDRGLDHHLAHQIPHLAGAHGFDALATHAEHLAGLGLRGYLELDPAVQGRHFDLATQGCRSEADGDFTVEVVTVTHEDLVLLDVHLHIQIASRCAGFPRFPFAGETDAIASIDASRDLDRQGLGLLVAPFAMALAARILDDLAATVTVRAGLLHCKETLTHLYLAGAVAGRAGLGRAPGVGAGAVTHLTVDQGRDLDLFGDTAHRLFQGQFHGIAQVGTTGRAATTTAAATKDVTEHIAKDVAEIGAAAKATVAATLTRIDTGMAVLIVTGTQVGIGQDLVSLLDLFEFLFSIGIALITVRVILHGQTLVRLLDLALVGIFRYPQHFVEIALRHTHPVAISAVMQTGVGHPTPVNS